MTIWRAGMDAVCINGDFRIFVGKIEVVGLSLPTPKKGSVYRVRRVVIDKTDGETMLVFAEFSGQSFTHVKFIPAVPIKTDISIFARLLTPSPRVKETA